MLLIMQFNQKILNWYKTFGRKDLPWQQNPTSYRVWVSEIMLQQTQVATVIPYFLKFMQRFPDIKSLAQASLDEVLQLWSGLGYYARAKNLHKSAEIIQQKYRGQFPIDFEEVVALPGIGRSTAGAILALSTGQRFPILDGNVKRVLCRHFAIAGSIQDTKVIEKLWDLSEKHTPKNGVGSSVAVSNYTQAIMDLGATLCTRAKPRCEICPLRSTCVAKKLNKVLKFPEKSKLKAKKPVRSTVMMLIVQPIVQPLVKTIKQPVKQSPKQSQEKWILLEKRPLKGIWGGLWSLPECSVENKQIKEKFKTNSVRKSLKNDNFFQSIIEWPSFRHTFTHFHLDITPVVYYLTPFKDLKNKKISSVSNKFPKHLTDLLSTSSQYQWHNLQTIDQLGLPAPVNQLLQQLLRVQQQQIQKVYSL